MTTTDATFNLPGPGDSESAIRRKPRPRLTRSWQRVLVLGTLLACVYLVALLAPVLAPHDPLRVSIADRLKPPGYVAADGGLHLLGTDGVGRDVLSRVLMGSRLSLLISICAVLIAAGVGSLVGLFAGYFRGPLETIALRLGDIWLAFPEILLALSVTAVLGPSVINLIVALGLSRWVSYVRLVRGNVLAIREREFITGRAPSASRRGGSSSAMCCRM